MCRQTQFTRCDHMTSHVKSRNRSVLQPFFEPASVAVIGSLRDGTGLGYRAIHNMLHFGFSGRIYPVNPSYSEVLGLKSYGSVGEVAEPVDLAIVITPPPTVPAIVEQCARKGMRGAVVVSENFAEAGGDGAKLQQQLVDIKCRTGIRIMGPNTIGLLNTANGFITVPYYIAYERIQKGTVTYCSQSGFVGPTAQPLEERAYPISKMCDVGNKCDVSEVDLLDYLADDPQTSVVAMHLEDTKDGRRFMEAARNVVAQKPLLVLKSGRSEAGARASASHTSSLAGNEQVYDGAFRQAGAIRVNTWQEFLEVPKVFAFQPLPRGNRIGILTHTGGAGVTAADAAVEAGLSVTSFSPATIDRLTAYSPRLSGNPIDLGPILSVADAPFSIQEEATAVVLNDPNVDCAMITCYGGLDALIPPTMEMFERLMQRMEKPVSIWIYGMKLSSMQEMARQLDAQGLPAYLDLETSVKALGIAAQYARLKETGW